MIKHNLHGVRYLVIFALLVGTSVLYKEATAGAIAVTDFTKIANARFIDVPASASLDPITFDSTVITADQLFVSGAFISFPTGGPSIPGDGGGYHANEGDISRPISSITLDFSSPLAAFGVTFVHMPPERGFGNDSPALLQIFDGPNGSGNLVGSITSSGLLTSNPDGAPSFVAVWSNAINIQSAVLTGTGPIHGFAVDGYAVSFTPLRPTNKDQCKNGGWKNFGFNNQGQCIQFVNTGKKVPA